MLDRDTPADIITYLYPNTNFKVRVHEHIAELKAKLEQIKSSN